MRKTTLIILFLTAVLTVTVSCASAYTGPETTDAVKTSPVITEDTTIPPPMTRPENELEITLQILAKSEGFVIATDGEFYYRITTSSFELNYARFASITVIYRNDDLIPANEPYSDNFFPEEIVIDYIIDSPIKLTLLGE